MKSIWDTFKLYTQDVAPVSDLCPEKNQFLNQATRFASDLIQSLTFQSLTRIAYAHLSSSLRVSTSWLLKHLGRVEQYQYHLLARYHLVPPVEEIEIDCPYNIYQLIHLPFLRGDF